MQYKMALDARSLYLSKQSSIKVFHKLSCHTNYLHLAIAVSSPVASSSLWHGQVGNELTSIANQ